MTKERKDTWTKKHDELLAKLVLDHLGNGSTQTKAFKEAAEKLNRTAAACGYRWNAVLRNEFDKELREVKGKKAAGKKASNKKGDVKSGIKEVKLEKREKKSSKPALTSLQEGFAASPVNDARKDSSPDSTTEIKVKVKHLLEAFEAFDGELPISELTKIQQENERLHKENHELKEEIRSVYLILDRLRRSANIDVERERQEAN